MLFVLRRRLGSTVQEAERRLHSASCVMKECLRERNGFRVGFLVATYMYYVTLRRLRGDAYRSITGHEPNLRQSKFESNTLGGLSISNIGLVVPSDIGSASF